MFLTRHKPLALTIIICGFWVVSTSAGPSLPVRYSANKRHLVAQLSSPYPILVRTAWFVISLQPDDYRTFLGDTAARGYNSIEFHVINPDPRGNNPPFNGDGDLPLLRTTTGTRWNG